MLTVLQKEEKFFSRSVTHVVTTRAIPSELSGTSPEDANLASSKPETANASVRTIDPALLGRPQEPHLSGAQRKTVNLLEATLQARTHTSGLAR